MYFRDDSPIKLIVGGEEINGAVVSFGDGVLVIASERDLGPKIPHAKIISHDSFLVERLKEKLISYYYNRISIATVFRQVPA